MVDLLIHNIGSLKDAGQYDLGSFLTSIMTAKLTKRLEEAWLRFSRTEKGVPDIELMIQFLGNHSDHTNDNQHHSQDTQAQQGSCTLSTNQGQGRQLQALQGRTLPNVHVPNLQVHVIGS